ncbi:quaternary amine ABC transporter ATP-binding protein [Zavarzinia sp. CC-PAN008]|uniref:quaternary amine ABC transporter ATP-binding protein n=1 Tax=Zavarzinia sp. CC-PAN008 TaxID=3243332 RepID=UPI003F7463C4
MDALREPDPAILAGPDKGRGRAMDEIVLACRDVWKVYGPRAADVLRANPAPTAEELKAAHLIGAVRAADVEVRRGEIFIIMGLSGSGKSTLVRCMSRLIEPTQGDVFFEGRSLLRASEKELIEIRRHKMGMVFQNFALLPHRTVLGNVAFPLEIQGVGRAERERRAQAVIELVGLSGRERYYPRELSGGQQQRVGIARSLAAEPDLWFLDEPFSALDPLIRREMQSEFLRLQRLLHKTIVFITHDFDEAIRLADRIAIMKDGAIVQIGTPEDLVMNPATDYVAEFTREVARAKVISVASVMTPALATALGPAVLATNRIGDIADRAVSSPLPLAVQDGHGGLVGQLEREAVIAVLAGTAAPPARR